jgi:hypothetical protein
MKRRKREVGSSITFDIEERAQKRPPLEHFSARHKDVANKKKQASSSAIRAFDQGFLEIKYLHFIFIRKISFFYYP